MISEGVTGEALFEATKIDLVSVSPDGSVHLHIVSDQPWTGSDLQIRSLQEKIHAYVGFAADGQLALNFPEAAELPWAVVINCQAGQPDPRTQLVVDQTRAPVQEYGGDLLVQGGP